MSNERTAFKNLNKRELADEPSTSAKSQNDNITASSNKSDETKISGQPKETNTQTTPKATSSKVEGVMLPNIEVAKNIEMSEESRFQNPKKPKVAQIQDDKPSTAPVTKRSESSATVDKSLKNKPSSDSLIAQPSCSSWKTVPPLIKISPPSTKRLKPTEPSKHELHSLANVFDAEHLVKSLDISLDEVILYSYLKTVELNFTRDLRLKSDLTTCVRTGIVSWMMDLQTIIGFRYEALFLSVKIFDAYLSKVSVNTETLPLIAAASIFIAWKFDQNLNVRVKKYLRKCGLFYTKEEFEETEMGILKSIDFNLQFPLSYVFLKVYARFANVRDSILRLARSVLLYTLMDFYFISEYDSKLAAAALLLALNKKNAGEWTPHLHITTGYAVEDITHTANILHNKIDKAANSGIRMTVVKSKHSHKILSELA